MASGRARWLGAALAGLRVATVRVEVGDAWCVAAARWPDAVFLLAEDDPDRLAAGVAGATGVPTHSTVLLWTSAPALTPAFLDHLLESLTAEPTIVWVCSVELHVLVTVHDGNTHIFTTSCDRSAALRRPGGSALRAVALGAWSGHREGDGGGLIPAPCYSWHPDAAGPRNTAKVLVTAGFGDKGVFVPKLLQDLQKLTNQTFLVGRHQGSLRDRPRDNCSEALVILITPVTERPSRRTQHFPWSWIRLLVVVPEGAGPPRPLHGIVGEFSVTLWCWTGVAVAAVVVASFVLARGWRRGLRGKALWDAVRTAFAPLLGQAAPEDQRRLLLGVWLLVCVVLSAAYTGELLADLSANQYLNIDSVEELAASELAIHAMAPVSVGALAVLLGPAASRLRYADRSLALEMASVAEQRDTALIMREEFISEVGPWLVDPPKVHVFYVQSQMLETQYLATTGSPLIQPVRRLLGRVRAGGLDQWWADAWKTKRHRKVLAWNPELKAKMNLVAGFWQSRDDGPRVLTLHDLAPAFVVLAAGLSLAMLVAGFERAFSKLWRWCLALGREK